VPHIDAPPLPEDLAAPAAGDPALAAHGLNPRVARAFVELEAAADAVEAGLGEMAAIVAHRLAGDQAGARRRGERLAALLPEDRRRIAGDLVMGRMTQLDEREVAAVTFATALAANPHGLGPDAIAALRAAGLDDRQIHDLAVTTAAAAARARIARALGG